ncbi:hypothetical protein AB6A40_005380 [Gnathostoma spinigerum]|uniref:Uncharacterized protein n=1 Tax=Gnathostoma spinigerum TaxID=75299 RepID=A0ABD6EMM5_9BILA
MVKNGVPLGNPFDDRNKLWKVKSYTQLAMDRLPTQNYCIGMGGSIIYKTEKMGCTIILDADMDVKVHTGVIGLGGLHEKSGYETYVARRVDMQKYPQYSNRSYSECTGVVNSTVYYIQCFCYGNKTRSCYIDNWNEEDANIAQFDRIYNFERSSPFSLTWTLGSRKVDGVEEPKPLFICAIGTVNSSLHEGNLENLNPDDYLNTDISCGAIIRANFSGMKMLWWKANYTLGSTINCPLDMNECHINSANIHYSRSESYIVEYICCCQGNLCNFKKIPPFWSICDNQLWSFHYQVLNLQMIGYKDKEKNIGYFMCAELYDADDEPLLVHVGTSLVHR